MRHNNPSFERCLARAATTLHRIVPQTTRLRSDPLDLAATLIALSRCEIRFTRREGALAPMITIHPDPAHSPKAMMLIDQFSTAILQTIHSPNTHFSISLEQTVNDSGYLDLVTDLVLSGADHRRITDMTQTIGTAILQLRERLVELMQAHLRAILFRDLGYRSGNKILSLGRIIHWALATDLEGDPGRKTVIRNRGQALSLYGAVATILLKPEVTAAIDAAQPLKPVLAAAVGISEAQLRRLRRATPKDAAYNALYDHMPAVRALVRHDIPLEQWPDSSEWGRRVWEQSNCDPLFRPDYLDSSVETRDTLQALREDLLYPLAGARLEALGLSRRIHALDNFVATLGVPLKLCDTAAHRKLLQSLHRGIIGPRRPRSFQKAIAKWHRRAASAAALRHENNADRPGWPALCPTWQSPCGPHSFIPLTSAQALVDEGNALNHCVGGYYSQCRRGDTQILSLRSGSNHVATLELLITDLPGNSLNINVGQFKARGNVRPNPEAFAVLRDFLADLRDGLHPVAIKELAAHRDAVADADDYYYRRSRLTLDHARRAWPLYRVLLPRGAPETYDEWCEHSGLTAALDDILSALARSLCTSDQRELYYEPF
ncbi:PcfJ domain-containing protein [Sphingobium bisphenolivorans]|jgi:hypothetical protein|nr:PcfJ domain-containing protein [Sphingobium bisphenolivorans]|tara:strand:- start:1515 stop:3326 length:1812 start_codon:yes stop_codon:yes gene_type:complete